MSTTIDPPADELVDARTGELAESVFGAAIGAFELLTIDLGRRLGLYEALAQGPATPPEVSARAGIDPRYAREWLEQQATAGYVDGEADAPGDDPDRRTFTLPEATRRCFLDPEGLAYVAPLAQFLPAAGALMDDVADAYRNGTGISFGSYGDDIRHAQAAANRPQFHNLLAGAWLPAMPDVVARLDRPGARIAELACGSGWAAIELANAFTGATVDAFDLDEPSVVDARANVAAAGLDDRVFVHPCNAVDVIGDGYDLVCTFESLHDLAHPVEALAAMKALVAPGGAVFVVDERAADAFTPADPDPVQRWLYAASVLHCLPVGRSEDDSAATGTVMRPGQVERYAAEAGFGSVEHLGIEHDLFRFYRLHP